ncbi:MAG TPA: hypothetical protein V6C52_08070 [Coleofasciculaceae cyanobacterium]|jgi:hypothetical protein
MFSVFRQIAQKLHISGISIAQALEIVGGMKRNHLRRLIPNAFHSLSVTRFLQRMPGEVPQLHSALSTPGMPSFFDGDTLRRQVRILLACFLAACALAVAANLPNHAQGNLYSQDCPVTVHSMMRIGQFWSQRSLSIEPQDFDC